MTGYVYNMIEKKQNFAQFALECARAFGALVELRDSPDSEIPESFTPSNYHLEELNKAQTRHLRLKSMDIKQRIAFGKEQKQGQLVAYQDALERSHAELTPCYWMMTKVKEWNPPSSEHTQLKKFMLEQLQISIGDGDKYWREQIAKVKAKSPGSYYTSAVENAERDIEYHTREYEKECQRAEERTEWLKQLRKSLSEVS